MMEKMMKALSAYAIGGAAITLVTYPWLAEYAHLVDQARRGDKVARARLADLIEVHPDRMAVTHLVFRVFPWHVRLVSEVLAERAAA